MNLIRALQVVLLLTWPLSWCVPSNNAPAQRYVTVRKVGASYAAIDTFTGPVDSLRMTYSSIYRVHARALKGSQWGGVTSCGDPATQHDYNLLALDWSGVAGDMAVRFIGQGALPNTGVAVWLPAKQWTVTYSFADSIPTRVSATCDFDYVKNVKNQVDLSDLCSFVPVWIASGRSLTLLGDFAACYNQAATKTWP
jgi:hypothetical protein